eukprot:scaffold292801_cov83-Cyclotella_meneghiniana.AAC.1
MHIHSLALAATILSSSHGVVDAQYAKFTGSALASRKLSDSSSDPAAATPSPTPNEPDPNDPGIELKHFRAYPSSHTCDSDSHALPFNNQIRGVNLGGWMVLEPWITPSLFYQFLDGNETSVAMDHYSFCEVLGPEEGNKQLRKHWETWVTEDIIRELAESGAVNSLRLPVAGCTDGALDYVDQLLDWARSYGLTVLFDVHTQVDSQNGFDNGGRTMNFEWTKGINTWPRELTTFQHWPIRAANWMGNFDPHAVNYTDINHENIEHSVRVVQDLVDKYHDHPAVLGIEPVNEPWELTPLHLLKQFTPETWGGFMKGCPDRALDTREFIALLHADIYQAWMDPAPRTTFYGNACSQKNQIALMEREFGPVVVGEWSLATDNCAMWLNGFNDNLPGFPRSPCKYIPCSSPYMNNDNYTQPGTPIDAGKGLQGPFGTGMSGPSFGLCPVDRDWMTERQNRGEGGTSWVMDPPEAPRGRDGTDE